MFKIEAIIGFFSKALIKSNKIKMLTLGTYIFILLYYKYIY